MPLANQTKTTKYSHMGVLLMLMLTDSHKRTPNACSQTENTFKCHIELVAARCYVIHPLGSKKDPKVR